MSMSGEVQYKATQVAVLVLYLSPGIAKK